MQRFPSVWSRCRLTWALPLAAAVVCCWQTAATAQGSLKKAKELRKAGKWLEADKEVNEYLKYNPNVAEAHVILGWCQLERENRLGAEKSFKKALELDPNVPGATEVKSALKLIRGSFAKPVKPPMPLKSAKEGEEGPKQTVARPEAQSHQGLVGAASGEGSTRVPTSGKAVRSGGSQLGGALDLDKQGRPVSADDDSGGNTTLLIVIIGVAGVAVGGLIAFLVARRGGDSDELVI